MGSLLKVVLHSVFAVFSASAIAQSYPSKPVKVIIPYAPGQGADIVGRYFTNGLSAALGQSFIVENRPGAGGNVGAAAGAKAPADGYTLVVGNSATHVMNTVLYKDAGFDPEKESEPIALFGMVPVVVAVHPSLGVKTVQELIAKTKVKTLDVAITNSMGIVVQQILTQRSGGEFFSVPYKGSATAITDLLGGRIQVIIDTAAPLIPQFASGTLVPLGITTLTSSDLLPGVRSIAEQGLPGFEAAGWHALFAPKGTPAAIINILNAEVRKIHSTPLTRKRLTEFGLSAGTVEDPKQFAEFIRAQRESWVPRLRAANIPPL